MAKVISKNKNAFFNYEVLQKFEAGIELVGWEVKSIRENKVNLKGSFCSWKANELYVNNMHISQYMNVEGDETRPRKLLLHKRELKKLLKDSVEKGITIVPLKLLWSNSGFVKIVISLAKGKNKSDKREVIKKRDFERLKKQNFMGM